MSKNKIDKVLSASKKIYKEVLSDQILLIDVLWLNWVEYRDETLKAEVEENYPNGFKDFLVEKIKEELRK